VYPSHVLTRRDTSPDVRRPLAVPVRRERGSGQIEPEVFPLVVDGVGRQGLDTGGRGSELLEEPPELIFIENNEASPI